MPSRGFEVILFLEQLFGIQDGNLFTTTFPVVRKSHLAAIWTKFYSIYGSNLSGQFGQLLRHFVSSFGASVEVFRTSISKFIFEQWLGWLLEIWLKPVSVRIDRESLYTIGIRKVFGDLLSIRRNGAAAKSQQQNN